MSGNPFRASLIQKHHTAAPPAVVPPTSFINADSSSNSRPEARERDSDSVVDDAFASALPAKTKKSVRIESPTESSAIPPHPAAHDADDDALLQRINSGRHAGSPPPISPAGFSDNFEDIPEGDAFGESSGSAEQVDALGMTRASRRNTGAPEASPSPSGAPANPFSRTLATLEGQEKGSGELVGQNRDRTATERSPTGPTKASLDVEGFKNLLMTGIPSPRSSGPPSQSVTAPNPISASVFESSSSTDTSSVSRQSIFEPVQEPHVETPRTSYEMAGSDDEERVSLMGEIKKEKKEKKKKPPPAPKHRHGKLVASRAPQTVSFEAFTAIGPTPSPPTLRARTNSDLNKPLPPTPPVASPPMHITSQLSQESTQSLPLPSISDTKASDTASLSDASSTHKKVPPPVPLARRHSQLRSSTGGNRSRSNSSLTMSSQHSNDIPVMSPGSTSDPLSSPPSQKAPPPPPPTRRHGQALASIITSSANSSSTELSSTATARRPTVSSPNPPSSRRTTFSSEPPSPSPGVVRSPSINSTRNNPRSVSNESATMPPPPPPPRRRQSGRSSLDQQRPALNTLPPSSSSPTESRRTSTEHKRRSLDGTRRTSVASESSLRHEYGYGAHSEQPLYSPQEVEESLAMDEGVEGAREEGAAAANSNILDDMEKFQKEIDELRARYRKAA